MSRGWRARGGAAALSLALASGASSGDLIGGGLLACALTACGGDEAPPDPVSEAPPTIRRHGGEEEAASEDTEAPPAVLMRSAGDVTVSSGVLAERLPLSPGDRVQIGPGGSADIDVREGARFSLGPGSDLRVGDVGPARVLLVRGVVHIANPPEDGPRAVLRVATPEASLAITGPGEAYLVAHESGTTVLMVLSGMMAVSTGETDGRGRLRELDLTPGRAVVIAQRMSESVEGPTRLDEARIDAAALLAASSPVDDARRRHDLGTAITRLDEALGTLEAEGRHGGELTEAHRAAVSAANPTESMRLQGELVAHSAHLFRLREVATSRWERLRVTALTVDGPVEPDPIEVRADRVRGLLGE